MLKFFIDDVIVMFGKHIFQQTVGIPMAMICPLLVDLLL